MTTEFLLAVSFLSLAIISLAILAGFGFSALQDRVVRLRGELEELRSRVKRVEEDMPRAVTSWTAYGCGPLTTDQIPTIAAEHILKHNLE